jgi:hypothetical protein
VKNFDQIKVGDKVVAQYLQALTLELKKGPGLRQRTEREAATRAKPGEKPAGAVARQVTIVADVIEVNPEKKLITLKGPKNNTVDLEVRNPDHLKVVKKGDQVERSIRRQSRCLLNQQPSLVRKNSNRDTMPAHVSPSPCTSRLETS